MGSNADSGQVGNIGKYEIRLSWREKAKIEDDITGRAPVTSKPPPPKQPIALSSDNPAGKGAEKGKGKGRPAEVQTQKGARAKERSPKEKMIQKEKKPKEIPEEGKQCRKWKKRIVMLQRVIILRRQR